MHTTILRTHTLFSDWMAFNVSQFLFVLLLHSKIDWPFLFFCFSYFILLLSSVFVIFFRCYLLFRIIFFWAIYSLFWIFQSIRCVVIYRSSYLFSKWLSFQLFLSTMCSIRHKKIKTRKKNGKLSRATIVAIICIRIYSDGSSFFFICQLFPALRKTKLCMQMLLPHTTLPNFPLATHYIYIESENSFFGCVFRSFAFSWVACVCVCLWKILVFLWTATPGARYLISILRKFEIGHCRYLWIRHTITEIWCSIITKQLAFQLRGRIYCSQLWKGIPSTTPIPKLNSLHE